MFFFFFFSEFDFGSASKDTKKFSASPGEYEYKKKVKNQLWMTRAALV